ncbi:hypothetical protein [Brucella pituitosa]|uniref:hypothetical protein n=1 Tax=Brucella pituitosa TaxID=571256 RepID=UPI003F4AB136
MKYYRTFEKKVKHGVMIYNSRPFLPFPVKVNSLIVDTTSLPDGSEYGFELSDLGELLSKGWIGNSKVFRFPKPLRIGIGKHEFKIIISGLTDLSEIEGKIAIDYSLTI